ncbi:MAG: hypothetical protein KGD70_00275 [Candidatus Lokiarchaeota archaeon]|nr:hypothetical protein [Candidatus Lokiarchaeota archaeon]
MLSTVHNSLFDNLLFYQKLTVKKKFSNRELLLFHFFFDSTKIFPRNVIIVKDIVFFFLDNEKYFEAKSKLPYLRKKIQNRRIVLVREEVVLVNLVFGFFPDPYIHRIRIERNMNTGQIVIIVGFLSYEERGIAVGCKGDYIKAINTIFESCVTFADYQGFQIKIKCEVVCL